MARALILAHLPLSLFEGASFHSNQQTSFDHRKWLDFGRVRQYNNQMQSEDVTTPKATNKPTPSIEGEECITHLSDLAWFQQGKADWHRLEL